MKISLFRLMPATDPDYPWMLWYYPTYDQSEPTVIEIDAWCERQWQHGAQHVQTTGGWKFQLDSHAHMLMMTWS
jgi:hypothetical protein